MELSLETYLRDINGVDLLTAQDERDLAHRIAQGDNEARDLMIRANLRLVVNIARGYTRRGLPLSDLIEEGNLGLLRAVEGFDPDMETRFSTYASYWIKQAIKRALINTAHPIRIPAYMVELTSKWRRAVSDLVDELGRQPTASEVCEALGLSQRKIPIIKRAVQAYAAAPQTEERENGWSIGEMLVDEKIKTPAEQMDESDAIRTILQLLSDMDEREAAVLRMRFGLDDDVPMTLKQIGEVLDLTRERVRQIENEALRKLYALLNDEEPPPKLHSGRHRSARTAKRSPPPSPAT